MMAFSPFPFCGFLFFFYFSFSLLLSSQVPSRRHVCLLFITVSPLVKYGFVGWSVPVFSGDGKFL